MVFAPIGLGTHAFKKNLTNRNIKKKNSEKKNKKNSTYFFKTPPLALNLISKISNLKFKPIFPVPTPTKLEISFSKTLDMPSKTKGGVSFSGVWYTKLNQLNLNDLQ